MADGLPAIFVSIASYRDPECQHTVRDLFAKAAHPERIHVGICWQYDPDKDAGCFAVPSPYPLQTQIMHCHPRDSKGGCWARAQALSMMSGEEYVLQIDAHMRFVKGWDSILIDTLSRCPAEKAGLTTTVPRYTPPDTLEDFEGHLPISHVSQVKGMGGLQPISIGGYKRKFGTLRGKGPVPTPFVVANFLFAKRRMFEEVLYDPHLYFRGQEACYSLRLWTHGYDLFHPDSVVAYHYWDAVARLDSEAQNYKSENPQALKARQRVWHILGLKTSDDREVLAEIEKYGLGTARTPADFWEFAGINIHTGEISEKAHFGFWTREPNKAA